MTEKGTKETPTEARKAYYEQHTADMLEKQKAFIEQYPHYGTVGRTMSAIGMGRRVFYDWLKDEEFNAVYQELKADRLDEIITRLIQCIKGEVVLTQQQLLAAFFLSKAFDPKTFSEKYQLQHTGKDGGAVKVTSIEIVRAEKADSSRVSVGDLGDTTPDV